MAHDETGSHSALGAGHIFLRDVARLAGYPDRGRAVRDRHLSGTKSQTIAFRLCAGRIGALEWRPGLPPLPPGWGRT
jgi:hypothetical protein